MVVAVLMRSASCVSMNRWRAHSVWCMTMISRVPSMLCESAMAFIASCVARPPALRMTCASPGRSPSSDAASTRASMQASTASFIRGSMTRASMPR